MRCFVAVELEQPLKEEISKFNASFNYISMKRVETENLHITLKFLGEIEEKRIEEIKTVLENISSKFEPFKIEFAGVGVFPSLNAARVLWIGIKGERMVELCRKIEDSFSSLGFPKEKNIVPHLTIGRIKHVPDKKRFREDLNTYGNFGFGEMIVNSIKIKKSLLSSKGPTYYDVKEVKL